VEVHCDEGVANHIGPEPCVSGREVWGEASAGESIGQPLSRESFVRGADAVDSAEGNTVASVIASGRPTLRGPRPWHVRKLLAWKPGDLAAGHRSDPAARIGKATSRSR
jgi:hypothetical protein